MIALIWSLLSGCVHPLPPGPSPAEQAAAPPEPVVVDIDGARSVYVQAAFQAGSAYDPVGMEGLAWLTARALREGGTADLAPEIVESQLYRMGAEIEVVVDREWVTFRGQALTGDADAFLALFSDLLLRPGWDPDAIERLGAQAGAYLAAELPGDPEALGREALDAWLHEGHPYGHPPEGRLGALDGLDAGDIAGFYAGRYVRQATRAGLAGDPAATAPLAARLAGDLVALPDAPHRPVAPAPRSRRPGRELLVVASDAPGTGLHFGHALDVDRAAPDYPALLLAATALGQHRDASGRLYRAIRTERGLNYGAYAYVEPYVQAGGSSLQELGTARSQPHFSVWLRPLDTDAAGFALKVAASTTEEWVASGLDQAELDRTRAFLQTRIAIDDADPARRLGRALEDLTPGAERAALSAAIDALTLEQVNAAIARHVDPGRFRIVAVTDDPERFLAGLEDPSLPSVYAADPDLGEEDRAFVSYPLDINAQFNRSARGLFR